MSDPRGHTTFETAGGESYRLEFDFNEVADADERLGRSVIQALLTEPLNASVQRVAFYFATRLHHKMKSVRDAGAALKGTDPTTTFGALIDALKASGMLADDAVEVEGDEPGEG